MKLDLVSLIQAASLGWVPDDPALGVRGTRTARESEHRSAPGFVDGGALVLPRPLDSADKSSIPDQGALKWLSGDQIPRSEFI